MQDRFLESYSESTGPDGSRVRRYEHVAMATWNIILLVERPNGPPPALLDRAAAGAFELVTELEEELSKFIPESEVGLLNALAATEPVVVSERVFELLEVSKRYHETTRGAFDPTIAPLMAIWGFDSGEGRVPSDDELSGVLQQCGIDHVQLDGDRGAVRFDRAGVGVDLGAIGKGFIVDRAVEHIKALGVDDGALVSGRSTVTVWGQSPRNEPWLVGVADPRSPNDSVVELRVADGSISTSAAYEKRFKIAGVDYGHVLDPRTGRPVSRCRGVSVWTPTALRGDVASTALFVLGRIEGEEILDDFAPIAAFFLEDEGLGGDEKEARLRVVECRSSGEAPGIEVVEP